MSKDSDLYGEDILLWSERQGDLLRRLAAGESVSDQVDCIRCGTPTLSGLSVQLEQLRTRCGIQ
jgi:hypothetical protein